MASVMEIRGTSYPSFFVGKKGPVISKSGTHGLALAGVDSNTIGVTGGIVSLTGGNNTSTSGNGGAINIAGGISAATGTSGSVSISGGAGATGSATSTGGSISIAGGVSSGTAGSVSLSSGSGATAGNISLISGNSITSSGGQITIAAGNGLAAGGDIRLVAGSNTGAGVTGSVIIGPAGTVAGSAGEIRFEELVANGTNYVGLKSPDLVPANVVWTLPSADGTSEQMLSTDGAGNMYWRGHPVPYEVYASTILTITNIKKKVPFNVERLPNADFSVLASVITINRAGVYTVEFTGSAKSTNTTRTTLSWDLYVNNVIYPASTVYSYHRTTTNGKTSVSRSVVLNAAAGTTVDVRCKRVNGNGAATLSNRCNIVIRGI